MASEEDIREALWQQRRSVKKGNAGEAALRRLWPIVRAIFIPECPDAMLYGALGIGQPHLLDYVALSVAKPTFQCHLDVKTKPHRNKYPDTGFDAHLLPRYRAWPRFLCLFADERKGELYGNWLEHLMIERTVPDSPWKYPSPHEGIIYFPLCEMITVAPLATDEITSLNGLRDSQHDREVFTSP